MTTKSKKRLRHETASVRKESRSRGRSSTLLPERRPMLTRKGGQFELVPEGVYDVELLEVREIPYGPGFQIKCRIAAGPQKGQHVFVPFSQHAAMAKVSIKHVEQTLGGVLDPQSQMPLPDKVVTHGIDGFLYGSMVPFLTENDRKEVEGRKAALLVKEDLESPNPAWRHAAAGFAEAAAERKAATLEQPTCATCHHHSPPWKASGDLIRCCWPHTGKEVEEAEAIHGRRYPWLPLLGSGSWCMKHPQIPVDRPAGSPVAPTPVDSGKKEPEKRHVPECSVCGEVIESTLARHTPYNDNVDEHCVQTVWDFLDAIGQSENGRASDFLIRLLALAGHKARVRVRQHEERMHKEELEQMDGGDRLGVPKERT